MSRVLCLHTRVREIREQRGESQETLAALFGKKRDFVSKRENDLISWRLGELASIATHWQMSIDDLLVWKEQTSCKN